MSEDTIFHRILRREIPADIVYEDDHVFAFRDIAPQAPVHVLFVPKESVRTLDAMKPSQAQIVRKPFATRVSRGREHELAEYFGMLGLGGIERCDRCFRHEQHMHRRLRRDVAERDQVVVLVHDVGGQFATDDLAEDGGVGHGRAGNREWRIGNRNGTP